MRIAIGGLATECCTFSPLLAQLHDFWVVRGAELLDEARYPFLAHYETAAFLPTLSARALPGGSIDALVYRQLKVELLQRLEDALPVDGMYLDLHGAMNVAGMDDAEGDLAAAIREIVGPDCLISASMDLHGNISQRFIDAIDMLSAYRTAPHIDYMETREKAVRMLLHCLEEGLRPSRIRIPVPVLLPGERTSTEYEPAASVYGALADSDKVPGILDASIFVGYVWADEPRASATVIVTGFDKAAMRTEAQRLAQLYWDARHDFSFGVTAAPIDECIQLAITAPEPCVFISDSGDNPTAGGVGDTPTFLGRLLALQAPDSVVASIADAVAVDTCFAGGINGELSLSLGGKLDPVHAQPLPVNGRVLNLVEADPVGGKIAVLQVDKVKVILTERRKPFHFIAEFEKLGIDPLAHKIVVVKIGYLVPDLRRAAPLALLALSPGAVDQFIERLPYKHIHRPMFPLDPHMT